MGIRRHIPNLLTLGNLFFGCLSIYTLVRGGEDPVTLPAIYLAASLVLDFLDGMVARMLHVKSDIGKELDSLADVVSFGVVPGMMMHRLLSMCPDLGPEIQPWLPFSGFLISMLSAYRLAKFNLDTRQTDSFIGLPTPANTILIFSLFATIHTEPARSTIVSMLLQPWFLLSFTVVSSWLLVAELPLFSLKVKGLSLSENWYRYVLVLISVLLYVLGGNAGLILVIPSYILLSILLNITRR